LAIHRRWSRPNNFSTDGTKQGRLKISSKNSAFLSVSGKKFGLSVCSWRFIAVASALKRALQTIEELLCAVGASVA
jgi:hypothetical protein